MSTETLSMKPQTDLLRGIPVADQEPVRRGRVLVVGAGNIGSWLVVLLAPLVSVIRVVDRDRIEARNRANQFYSEAAAVGQFKSDYLARWTTERYPNVKVESRPIDLEHLPLGEFADADVIAGGLDSLRGRQVLIADRACPLGKTVVDGGVGEPLIGRVHVFVPGAACVECAWGPQHYRELNAEYPCVPGAAAQGVATPAPALLGATVAGMMAAEIVNILAGRVPKESRELHFDFFNRRFLTSKLRRASQCRADHAIVKEQLRLEVPFARATVGDVLQCLCARFQTEPATLMLRGGLLLDSIAPGGIVSSSELEPLSSQRLADLGFSPRDWIRAQTLDGEQRVFLRFENDQAVETRSAT